MSSSNNQSNNQSDQPSLVAGHAEYVKGIAESTIGSLTGSESWTASGEQAKQHAVESLRQAAQRRDPNTQGYGKTEEVAGKLTGCEGMKQEGAASANNKRG